MIKIKALNDGQVIKPELPVDYSTVTSVHCDCEYFYYFEGDEPKNISDSRLDDVITEQEQQQGWTTRLINYFKNIFSNG